MLFNEIMAMIYLNYCQIHFIIIYFRVVLASISANGIHQIPLEFLI